MTKKIKFPLKLADGTQARTIEELKEHFDLESVLEHYKSGKLLTWLRDRYFETEADAVEALDENAPDFQQALCEVFGVEFSGVAANMEEIAHRQERLALLRQFTDEDEFIQNIDAVAFDQEELADLLDEDCEKIYLCGERFTVPISRKGVTYVGVNSPTVHISGKVPDKIEDLGIQLVGVNCDNLPVAEEKETEPKIFTGEHSDDIPEEVADNIYRELAAARCDYIETDDYILFEKPWCSIEVSEYWDSKEDGIYAINKSDGNQFLVIAQSTYSEMRNSGVLEWKSFKNIVFVRFSDSADHFDSVYMLLDIENKRNIEAEKILQLKECIDTNGRYFIYSGKKFTCVCVDLDRKKKYLFGHNSRNEKGVCTESAFYFITYNEELVEYSFVEKNERILTKVPYGVKDMAIYNKKLFFITCNEIGYVNLESSSEHEYQQIHKDMGLSDRYTRGDPQIKKYRNGWTFIEYEKFSLMLFDFQTMELTKLAEDCGHSEWHDGGWFSKDWWSYDSNPYIKIGKWVYFKQGNEGPHVKVSINHPMSIEVLGDDL